MHSAWRGELRTTQSHLNGSSALLMEVGMDISLTSLVIWLLVGLIAGWLAGELWRGRGYGTFGNIALGIVGAVVGGVLLGALGVDAGGFLGEVVQAVIGALVVLAVAGILRDQRVVR
jgi:uncharacterized membrane protein YeaQ/YmgE (transglycosylase-associated protein family)